MKILVVDDEDLNAFFLKKMLGKDGHEVSVANDGEQAIEKVSEDIPDLILMDILMPKLDGYEATKILKKKYEGKFLPIIFVSALSANEALIKCLEHGGDDYISKPIDKEVLTAKIVAMGRTIRLHQVNENQNNILKKQQAQLDHEKRLAEEIFSNLLHKNDYDPEFIRFYHKPADTFNGDVLLAVKSPRGGVNILLGDFTGHGLVAAICALPVVEIFYAMSIKGYLIQDILLEINYKICSLLPKGRFFAANMIHINQGANYLEIINAGMPDVLIYNEKKGIQKRFISHNIPLGIMDNSEFEISSEIHEFESGDHIFAYSDGLLEAENIDSTIFYGQTRLEQIIENNLESPNMVNTVQTDLELFSDKEDYSDDVSLLEIVCSVPQKKIISTSLKENRVKGNWEFSLHLDYLNLKREDSLPIIISMLTDIDKKNMNREVLLLLVTEMFNNALEHGLLKLDSVNKNTTEGFTKYYEDKHTSLQSLNDGYIKVNFCQKESKNGGKLHISVEDSGNGFDASRILSETVEMDSSAMHGLNLINSFCSEIEFNEKGNEIRVILQH